MGSTSAIGSEQVRNRVVGALFFIGFGAVWVSFGLTGTRHASPPVISLLAAVTLSLLALAVLLLRDARDLTHIRVPRDERLRAQRMFHAVNIILWVSVATAVAILNLLRMPEYISTAIAILVGLHLFPLAESFRNRQHCVTGTLLVTWPLLCLAIAPRSRVSGVSALGTGTILLLSAAALLLQYLVLLRGGAKRLAASA